MLAQYWRLQEFTGIVVTIAFQLQKTEERAHAAQYSALRTRVYADVVQRGGKVLQVRQLHVEDILVHILQIVDQLQQVTDVSIQRIWRVATLQFQVALIAADNICRRFLVLFHFYFVPL